MPNITQWVCNRGGTRSQISWVLVQCITHWATLTNYPGEKWQLHGIHRYSLHPVPPQVFHTLNTSCMQPFRPHVPWWASSRMWAKMHDYVLIYMIPKESSNLTAQFCTNQLLENNSSNIWQPYSGRGYPLLGQLRVISRATWSHSKCTKKLINLFSAAGCSMICVKLKISNRPGKLQKLTETDNNTDNHLLSKKPYDQKSDILDRMWV